jgi:zinc transporter 1/2/3
LSQVLLSQKHLSFATAILLAGALCIHSILEGIALGAQANLRDKQHIMLAIVAHKGLAAYALGASIMESKVRGAMVGGWCVCGGGGGRSV